jgi:hypothetical protein
MDEELRGYLEAMEARLMRHLNDASERALDRISTLERELRNLHAEHAATRELVIKLPGAIMSTVTTALGAFERALLDRLAQSEALSETRFDEIVKLVGGLAARITTGNKREA